MAFLAFPLMRARAASRHRERGVRPRKRHAGSAAYDRRYDDAGTPARRIPRRVWLRRRATTAVDRRDGAPSRAAGLARAARRLSRGSGMSRSQASWAGRAEFARGPRDLGRSGALDHLEAVRASARPRRPEAAAIGGGAAVPGGRDVRDGPARRRRRRLARRRSGAGRGNVGRRTSPPCRSCPSSGTPRRRRDAAVDAFAETAAAMDGGVASAGEGFAATRRLARRRPATNGGASETGVLAWTRRKAPRTNTRRRRSRAARGFRRRRSCARSGTRRRRHLAHRQGLLATVSTFRRQGGGRGRPWRARDAHRWLNAASATARWLRQPPAWRAVALDRSTRASGDGLFGRRRQHADGAAASLAAARRTSGEG